MYLQNGHLDMSDWQADKSGQEGGAGAEEQERITPEQQLYKALCRMFRDADNVRRTSMWTNGGYIEIRILPQKAVEEFGLNPQDRLINYRSNPSRHERLRLVEDPAEAKRTFDLI